MTIYKLLISAFSLLLSFHISAQDYSKQVNALQQSFEEKSTLAIEPHISDKLQFGKIPTVNTLPILKQVMQNFPKLNSLQILKSKENEVLVKYDFQQLGESESYIGFDEQNKIISIQLIEDIIKEELEAQEKMKESVQIPVQGELSEEYPFTKISFPSKDGLMITGNLYEINKTKPTILLCHQAGYNKYEYLDIAPRLNDLGYNCLAIDQRSGGTFAQQQNETYELAKSQGIENLEYIDAQQDIEAAIDYLNKKYHQKIIIWGSSYSSSLVLFIAQNNSNVKASISFSPGNYFGNAKKPLEEVFKNIDKPFFITSSKKESTTLQSHLKTNLKNQQVHFIPKASGFHGSRVLWAGQKGAEEYWIALTNFLESIQ